MRSIIVVSVIAALAVVVAFRFGEPDDRAVTNTVDQTTDVILEQVIPKEPDTFDVVVKFTGTELNGQIIAGLFDSERGFAKLKKPLQRCETTPTPQGDAACEFTNLPPGDYVISAFEDSNDNSKLDKNGFGMPQEKYGFSNNARRPFGPPKYLECKFEVSAATEVEIELR